MCVSSVNWNSFYACLDFEFPKIYILVLLDGGVESLVEILKYLYGIDRAALIFRLGYWKGKKFHLRSVFVGDRV